MESCVLCGALDIRQPEYDGYQVYKSVDGRDDEIEVHISNNV